MPTLARLIFQVSYLRGPRFPDLLSPAVNALRNRTSHDDAPGWELTATEKWRAACASLGFPIYRWWRSATTTSADLPRKLGTIDHPGACVLAPRERSNRVLDGPVPGNADHSTGFATHWRGQSNDFLRLAWILL